MEITHEEFKKAMQIVLDYKKQLENNLKEVNGEIKYKSKFYACNKDMKIYETYLSVRNVNILHAMEKYYVNDLEGMSKKEFLSMINAGKACLEEIKELCKETGIILAP